MAELPLDRIAARIRALLHHKGDISDCVEPCERCSGVRELCKNLDERARKHPRLTLEQVRDLLPANVGMDSFVPTLITRLQTLGIEVEPAPPEAKV